ncbi:MAG TPA: hypothetical protein VEP72_03390, partial [Microbacterium sp.]|nr:hypothetical protein [Microbacterium sp.]
MISAFAVGIHAQYSELVVAEPPGSSHGRLVGHSMPTGMSLIVVVGDTIRPTSPMTAPRMTIARYIRAAAAITSSTTDETSGAFRLAALAQRP